MASITCITSIMPVARETRSSSHHRFWTNHPRDSREQRPKGSVHKSLGERNYFIEIIQKPAKRYSQPPKVITFTMYTSIIFFNHYLMCVLFT